MTGPSPEELSRLTAQALLLALVLSAPALLGAVGGGILSRVVERTTGLQQAVLGPTLRLVGVAAGLALAAPWIGEQVLQFARQAWLALGGP